MDSTYYAYTHLFQYIKIVYLSRTNLTYQLLLLFNLDLGLLKFQKLEPNS